jgi:hypothetical protein
MEVLLDPPPEVFPAMPIHYMPMLLTCEEVQKVDAFIQNLVALRGAGAAAVESQSFAASELPLSVGGDLDSFASATLGSHLFCSR